MTLPYHLIDAWTAAEAAAGNNIRTALGGLSAATGVNYTHSRLSTWRTGVRPIPPAAARYMLAQSLRHVLTAAGIVTARTTADPALWGGIVDAISPPKSPDER